MYILGINAYHAGSSACLIHDGRLVAAIEEERFNRVKYWAGFPTASIKWVLQEAGIQAYNLDHVGISRNPGANLLGKVKFALVHRPSLDLIKSRLSSAAEVRDPKTRLIEGLGLERRSLKATFHNVEHHHAHMASAFLVSPSRDAAVLSIDQMGDFVSTMWGVGTDTRLRVRDSIGFPHSLGTFYTAVCQWLGFNKYGDEGKVMGLAPYGTPRHLDKMRELVKLQSDGTFELNLDYFLLHTEFVATGVAMSWEDGGPTVGTMYSPRIVTLLGEPREPDAEITQYHMDIASSMQAMLEEAGLALLRKLQRETGKRAVCLAGGVALNSVLNGKILLNTEFEDIYIHAAAGDAGTALGVCYYIWNQILGQPRSFVMTDAYTGPCFTNDAIKNALDSAGFAYEQLDDDALFRRTARMVAEGDVVGWFQGRMEWGPRALGARSIIADPRRADMKDILNARIKRREKFRPFAPSIQLEHTVDYFEQSYPDPFMLKVYQVKAEKRAEIPAVTHVDGSGRLQTVDREHSRRYWGLIDAFRDETGVPVVLNTSFNENEPIVCAPGEAIDCFARTRMDALAIGNFVVHK